LNRKMDRNSFEGIVANTSRRWPVSPSIFATDFRNVPGPNIDFSRPPAMLQNLPFTKHGLEAEIPSAGPITAEPGTPPFLLGVFGVHVK
jgi:hypothetical protein